MAKQSSDGVQRNYQLTVATVAVTQSGETSLLYHHDDWIRLSMSVSAANLAAKFVESWRSKVAALSQRYSATVAQRDDSTYSATLERKLKNGGAIRYVVFAYNSGECCAVCGALHNAKHESWCDAQRSATNGARISLTLRTSAATTAPSKTTTAPSKTTTAPSKARQTAQQKRDAKAQRQTTSATVDSATSAGSAAQ